MNKSQPRDRCYICGNDNPTVLQTHHIVPRRHGGTDSEENLVRLCANCHQAVESMYDRRFYKKMAEAISPGQVWNREDFDPKKKPVAAFVEEAVVPAPISEGMPKPKVYEAFNNFLQKHGRESWDFGKRGQQTKFGRLFRDAFPEPIENTRRNDKSAFAGVALTMSGEELLTTTGEAVGNPNTHSPTSVQAETQQ